MKSISLVNFFVVVLFTRYLSNDFKNAQIETTTRAQLWTRKHSAIYFEHRNRCILFEMFRIGGNIKIEDTDNSYKQPESGSKLRIHIGKHNKSLSFIQYLQPLSAKNPYFYVHILNKSINRHTRRELYLTN